MSLRYDIRLVIRYTYDTPVGSNRVMLRMMPMTMSGQQMRAGQLEISPKPNSRVDDTDFFGNAYSQVALDGPMEACQFRFAGRVERHQAPSALDLSCPLADLRRDILAINSLARDAPHHFLGPSPRTPPDPSIARFANDVITTKASTLEAVTQIAQALNSEIKFDPGATEVSTTPGEAFAARHGVCQDISHIMITALRALGIPAGYVSGFLRTNPPEGQPRLEGADAMHAWVRAWCGSEMGWVDIDPTNNIRAGNDHLTVAIGRDYSDAAPVTGALRTSGGHRTSHSVDVVEV